MQSLTLNKNFLKWIDEVVSLTKPEEVMWIDGSEEQLDKLRKQACNSGEIIALNKERYPGCYYHRSKKDDVARMEDKTFICSSRKEDAGPTNNWKNPEDAYKLG